MAVKEALKQINTKKSSKSIEPSSMHPKEIKREAAMGCGT